MNEPETWSELALEMGVTVDALLAQTMPVCPRKGVKTTDEQGRLIPCDVCGKCSETLPF